MARRIRDGVDIDRGIFIEVRVFGLPFKREEEYIASSKPTLAGSLWKETSISS
jgi:hypothetical protein